MMFAYTEGIFRATAKEHTSKSERKNKPPTYLYTRALYFPKQITLEMNHKKKENTTLKNWTCEHYCTVLTHTFF